MELPLFMRMVQAYHLTYAAETLGADKEKKAAFARSTYNIELGHKPVEDALYKFWRRSPIIPCLPRMNSWKRLRI